jgi:cellulose synthase/poly-beta-1,6-N-acetylglucosamine synthase-like glycosyltransferase
VSWENGKTIAEDTLFAVSARTKCGSTSFGWHGGVIEEKSPLSLRDLVKQRKRWFYGLIQNLKFIPLKEKIVQGSRALLWSLGFYSGVVSIIALVIPQYMGLGYDLDYLVKTGFLLTTVLWLLSYQIGGFFNGKYLPMKRRLLFHSLILVFSFFLGLIECATPILALISRPKTFEIVKK